MAIRKNKLIILIQFLSLFFTLPLLAEDEKVIKDFIKEFVMLKTIAPEIIVDLKYASYDNFTGRIVPGYENNPPCITTKALAISLKKVNNELSKDGLSLKVLDAYRPKKSVNAFIAWAEKEEDFKTKEKYYPYFNKPILLEERYIASPSNHSRGSSVDVTIIYKDSDGNYKEMDMGSPFDFFGEASHYDTNKITNLQHKNRLLLKTTMEKYGFVAYQKEWWHFTLKRPTFQWTEFDFAMNELEELKK